MAVTSKTCTRCKFHKPLDEYSGHPKAADGKQSQCKACFAERARLRKAGRPCKSCGAPLPATAKPRARQCSDCLAKCTSCKTALRVPAQRLCTECQAAKDKQRKAPKEVKLRERVTRIKTKYKVRPALAAALAVVSTCEACGKKQTRAGEMHIDHCHGTGKVRGVLCFNCNAALGHVGDDQDRLRNLLAYLERKADFKTMPDLQKARHYVDLLIELEVKSKAANKEQ